MTPEQLDILFAWLRDDSVVKRIAAAREIGHALVREAFRCGRYCPLELEFVVCPDIIVLLDRAVDRDAETIELLEKFWTPIGRRADA